MNMLIIGASSAISKAAVKLFIENGWRITLAGRNRDNIENMYKPFGDMIAGIVEYDAMDPTSHLRLWDALPESPDGILCAVGTHGDDIQMTSNNGRVEEVIRTNFLGLLPLLSLAANVFEDRQSGIIICISSVAGERGRASNYVYGSAKAGLTTYLSGLRSRLSKKSVHVITVLPGFVNTAMFSPKGRERFLTASPEHVANAIMKAIKRKRDVVYVFWFWKWIMAAIRVIPEFIFKRIEF